MDKVHGADVPDTCRRREDGRGLDVVGIEVVVT